jgi:cardiolipin synthase
MEPPMFANVPNILTLVRIGLIPVLAALFFIEAAWAPWAACAAFVAAAATDWFDGYLARRLDQESAIGKLLDPIADKMLVASTLFLLVGFDRVGGWSILPALVILLREFLVSGMREYLAGLHVGDALKVSGLAKWKTAVQMLAMALLIVGQASPAALPVQEIGLAALWLAGLLTLITGGGYMAKGLRLIAADQADDAGERADRPHAA